MGVRGHEHGPVQHASELDIVDVARAAGEEALVLHAPHRLPDAKAVHVFLLRCMADHTRAGEKGKSRWWMPSGRSASITAFATAGSAPVVPASPAPLTPSGLVGDGTEWSCSSTRFRISGRGMA